MILFPRLAVQAVAPWLLCAVSLLLLALGSILRAASSDGSGDLGQQTVGAIGFAGAPLVGALIVSRQPGNRYGWLWCAVGLALALLHAAGGLASAGILGPRTAGLLIGVAAVSGLALLVFVLLLFPDGRPPGPAWSWVMPATAVLSVAACAAFPFAPPLVDPAQVSPWTQLASAGGWVQWVLLSCAFGLVALLFVAVWSLVVRFRRAAPLQRQQVKWFLAAAVAQAVLIPPAIAVLEEARTVGGSLAVLSLYSVTFLLLPAAVGIAVLRYRLYEIDRIISRTVAYTLLTVGLGVLYLGLVATLGSLLDDRTGNSSLGVAASTLAVAAAFLPARRRVQAAVDRRFDRARFDAVRTVEAYAARLRDQVDLDEVIRGLRDTVAATVAPVRVSLWIRERPGPPGGRGRR